MNLAVIGSGGREHAICYKLNQSKKLKKLICIPGNAGTEIIAKNINEDIRNFDAIYKILKENNIDIVIIGPEQPLVDGMADYLRNKSIRVLGPNKFASQLEGSKAFMKDICKKNNIPTADYGVFDNLDEAKKFIKKNKSFGIYIETVQTGVNSNIGARISKITDRIKEKNFLLLNGDAIFDVNLNYIFDSHCKKNYSITFLSGEVTYPYGSIGVLKNKVIDFQRNLIFDQLKVRNNKNYKAYNFTGICIVKTAILKKYKNKFKNAENFEQTFYPKIIKNYKTRLVKIDGFWHSIDNIKDLTVIDNKSKNNYKFNILKKLKAFIKLNN